MEQRPAWADRVAVGGALALLAFAVTVVGVVRHTPLIHLDGVVRDFTIDHRSATGFAILSVVTWFGTFSVMGPALVALGAVLGWFRRSLVPFVFCSAAVLLLGTSVGTGKLLIDRKRPPVPVGVALAEDGSFPSGHTTTSVVLAFVLLLLVQHRLSRRGNWVGLGLVVLFTAIIGTSRVYLGAHWLTDVVGGWLLGSAISAALALGWWATQPWAFGPAQGRAPGLLVRALAEPDQDPAPPHGREGHGPTDGRRAHPLLDRFDTARGVEAPRDPHAEGAPS